MKMNIVLTLSSAKGFGSKVAHMIKGNMDGLTQIVSIESVKKDGSFLKEIQDHPVKRDLKVFLVMPEFNASYPAYFKEWIDNQGWPNQLAGVKIFLVGYSGSFSGNALGVDHMRTVLNYIGADTFPKAAHFTHNGSKEIHNGTNSLKETKIFLDLIKQFNKI